MLTTHRHHVTRSQLAKSASVGIETLRFYEKRGLLPEPPRGANSYRYYPKSHVERLQFIQRAKELGFTLDEITELLSLHENHGDRFDVKALAQQKIAELDRKLADLSRMRSALASVTHKCKGHGDTADCPIIASLIQG